MTKNKAPQVWRLTITLPCGHSQSIQPPPGVHGEPAMFANALGQWAEDHRNKCEVLKGSKLN